MQISELANRSGVAASALRFYETIGLLPAARTSAGYRDYDEDAIDRLQIITEAKRLGLSLDDIGELLGVWTSGSCARTKAELRPRLLARLSAAQRDAGALLARAGAVQAALAHLESLPDSDELCSAECMLPSWPEPTIACSLTDTGRVDRLGQWRAVLVDAVRAPLPDGLRLTMPIARIADVATLAAAEQACCPFFDLRIHLDHAGLHLEVRIPEAATEILAEVFAPAL